MDGFWSLTLYYVEHFFAPNDLKRYSLGTKNKTLVTNADGPLTIYVQANPPPEAQRANWLPSPKGSDFSVYMRAYWPKTAIIDGVMDPARRDEGELRPMRRSRVHRPSARQVMSSNWARPRVNSLNAASMRAIQWVARAP